MATRLEHIGHAQTGTARGHAAHAALAARLPQPATVRWDWLPRLPSWLDPWSTLIALKTGGGLVIAMSIALWLDWSPTGAAFAVIMLQTTYLGRTLGRSVLRAVGAVAGALVAMALMATFVQERALMIAVVALTVGLIIYLEQISNYPYAFLFVLLSINLISFGSIDDPDNAFNVAVSWVSGNALGITIVLILHGVLWPHTGEKSFEKQLRTLLQGLSHLFALKTAALADSAARDTGDGEATQGASASPMEEVRELEAHLVQALSQLRLALGIAARDTVRITRFAGSYSALIDQLQSLTSALIMYGETVRIWSDTPLAATLSRRAHAPGTLFEILRAQLDDLVAGYDRPRDGSEPPADTNAFSRIEARAKALREELAAEPHSALEAAALDALCDKATETSRAITATREGLATLEHPGRHFAQTETAQIDIITRIRSPALLLQKSLMGMIAIIAASALWINLDWPVPSSLLVFVVVPIGLSAMVPVFPLGAALKSLLLGPTLGAVLYFGVMPQLDGMAQLAPILMLFFFPTAYMTNSTNPATMVFGLFSSLWIVVLIDLSQGQVYDFAQFANGTIGIVGAVGTALITLAFFNPPRPERQLKTHVRTFLERCERAVQEVNALPDKASDPDSVLRMRRAERLELLSMCELWAHHLDQRRHPEAERAKVGTFIASLWALAFRLEALAQACRRHPHDPLIAAPAEHCRQTVLASLRALRDELASGRPGAPAMASATTADAFRNALEPLHAEEHSSFDDHDPLYQSLTLAGYYCALADEVEACRASAGEIDWRKWDLGYF